MNIQENYSLKNHNTFGVDVTAKYFVEVTSTDELLTVLKNNQPLFLGGGSNILFTQDFDGLVIQLGLKGISEEIINAHQVLVTSQAGENWHRSSRRCSRARCHRAVRA